MILDSLALADLGLVAVVVAVSLYAGLQAVRILRGWEEGSDSAGQLERERRTHLVGSLARLALLGEVVGALLFVATASGLHHEIQGAMCAFGALNANRFGFPALGVKVLGVFAFGLWLSVDGLDRGLKGFPLLRRKYYGFLLLLPLVLLDAYLTTSFFLAIDPNVVASCCSTALSPAAGFGSTGFREALPPGLVFAAFLAFTAATGLLARSRPAAARGVPFSLLSLGAFGTGAASMTLFVAPHVYEVIHFCPFDLLLAENGFVGYPMYVLLAAGGVYGSVPAFLSLFRDEAPAEVGERSRRAARRSALALLVLAAIFTYLVAKYYLSRGAFIV